MSSLQSVVLTLSLSYALIGALLLDCSRLCAPALVGQGGRRGRDQRVLHCELRRRARIIGVGQRRQASRRVQIAAGPHRRAAFAGGRSGRDLSVGRDPRRRQPAERRSQGVPASLPGLAGRKDRQGHGEIAAGRPQGGRAADFGDGGGSVLQAAREYITPSTILDTSGGDPSTGGGLLAAPRAGDEVSFTPLLPPRMPPKDEQ